MKKIQFLFIIMLGFLTSTIAQTNDSLSTDTAYQNYINSIDTTSLGSDLSLEAVAELFRTSEDLADFEKKLNDADQKVNNLDLNGDGEVDYLRVVDHQNGDSHTIVIQAVLGDNVFQDVASIDLVKEGAKINMQIVGNEEIYGTSYYIEPEVQEEVKSYPTVTVMFHVGYSPYYSPYYWGYYPPYYSPWHRYPPYYYHRHIYHHYHRYHHYHYAPHPRYPHSRSYYNNHYRRSAPNHIYKPRNTVNTRPQTRPSSKPQKRPSARPQTRPSTKPKVQPKPQARPQVRRPQAKPQVRPQARPQARPRGRRR